MVGIARGSVGNNSPCKFHYFKQFWTDSKWTLRLQAVLHREQSGVIDLQVSKILEFVFQFQSSLYFVTNPAATMTLQHLKGEVVLRVDLSGVCLLKSSNREVHPEAPTGQNEPSMTKYSELRNWNTNSAFP
ncbi:hypothetical protein PAXRUDRAFT_693523 [Paxillus rubicundulus Ve08.2h10]|uniref:Uncharacterized protein n=1 Tax=Paxillus rubicundulus Ve08.2h10 TaxID=930991 RepID=A0A0D0DAZ9_9AGAM|nr:hypothetical protein PAXRUDRAFT_693523 [Paxillus rubicundulus Ve08.2h10]